MGIFKSPKAPPPPPLPPAPPPIPTEVSAEVVKARTDQRQKALRGAGRASTILTSPQGLPSISDPGKKTLLGV